MRYCSYTSQLCTLAIVYHVFGHWVSAFYDRIVGNMASESMCRKIWRIEACTAVSLWYRTPGLIYFCLALYFYWWMQLLLIQCTQELFNLFTMKHQIFVMVWKISWTKEDDLDCHVAHTLLIWQPVRCPRTHSSRNQFDFTRFSSNTHHGGLERSVRYGWPWPSSRSFRTLTEKPKPVMSCCLSTPTILVDHSPKSYQLCHNVSCWLNSSIRVTLTFIFVAIEIYSAVCNDWVDRVYCTASMLAYARHLCEVHRILGRLWLLLKSSTEGD